MFACFATMHRLAATILSTMLPAACALCHATCQDGLCSGCAAQFFGNRRRRCDCCAVPLSAAADLTCGECLRHPPAFDATVVAADYVAPIDQLVLALKFGAGLALAPLFAHQLRAALSPLPQSALPQTLTAVPLGQQRLTERGFNQALEIARPLSRALGIELQANLTLRCRETPAQALLHPDQRNRNIRHAFTVSPGALDHIRGRHIGVVDDVMTTGSTLNELAATLKRFGAVRVTNIVFARTLPR